MSQNLEFRILLAQDKDKLLAFGKRRLAAKITDAMECEMQSWNARWRGEALDHYLKMGWSYGAYLGEELQGFVLGQPLLFFRGLTQTLWIETLEAESPAVAQELLDCTVRWARDKHFQCVVHEAAGTPGALTEIKTARFI